MGGIFIGSCGMKKNVIDLEKKNQETIVMKVGESYFIHLRENPSTGHIWKTNVPSDCNATIGKSDYKQDDAEPMMVGVPGTRSFEIIGKSSGECTIEFEHKVPGTNATVDTRKLKVIIK